MICDFAEHRSTSLVMARALGPVAVIAWDTPSTTYQAIAPIVDINKVQREAKRLGNSQGVRGNAVVSSKSAVACCGHVLGNSNSDTEVCALDGLPSSRSTNHNDLALTRHIFPSFLLIFTYIDFEDESHPSTVTISPAIGQHYNVRGPCIVADSMS